MYITTATTAPINSLHPTDEVSSISESETVSKAAASDEQVNISDAANNNSGYMYDLAAANDALALTETIDNALANMQRNLEAMRDLAIQTQDSSLDDFSRSFLNMEYSFVQSEISYSTSSTMFDGAAIFTDTFEQTFSLTNQDGSETTLTISLENSLTILNGVNGTDISSVSGGQDALTKINDALSFISSTRQSLTQITNIALEYVANAPQVDDETRANSDVLTATGEATQIYNDLKDTLDSMYQLANKSFDSSLSDIDKQYLQIEYQQLQVEVQRISSYTVDSKPLTEGAYSGEILFTEDDGSETSFDITLGEDLSSILATLNTSLDSFWDSYDALGVLKNALANVEQELENINEFEVSVASYLSGQSNETDALLNETTLLLTQSDISDLYIAQTSDVSKEHVVSLLG